MKYIAYEDLLEFTQKILCKVNLDDFSAASVAYGLCETSLRGVDSHGIRLLPHYVESALKGRKNPKPNFKIETPFPAIISLDADHAFGHAAGLKAIELGIETAKKNGICAVWVYNSSHPGAMATFALQASRQGYACFCCTHADALMLSYNGENSFFGTNPICFTAPRAEQDPFCLDMATTKVSWNKIKIHRENNTKLPMGLAADSDGNETLNPHDAKALFPIGDYKGFGLAAMVEILCSVFTGMKFATQIPPMFTSPLHETRSLGQFYLLFRVDSILQQSVFEGYLQSMTNQLRESMPKGDVKVMAPGDPEIQSSLKRKKEGIPIPVGLWGELTKLSTNYNVSLPRGID